MREGYNTSKNENLKTSHINNIETDREECPKRLIRKELNGTQKDIINFCPIPRSRRDILNHIGKAYHSDNYLLYIKPLMDSGFIEMTIPEKPNNRNQKYRKVRKDKE